MEKLIPQIIQQLQLLNKSSNRYAPLVDYYLNVADLSQVRRVDTYIYKGLKINIGTLIGTLRMQYKKGLLPEQDIKALESLGMIWVADTVGRPNKERLMPVKAYYAEFGTLDNIKRSTVYNYNGSPVRIGELLEHMRHQHKYGNLKEEYVNELKTMGFKWEIHIWHADKLDPLRAYYKQYGTISNIKNTDKFEYNGKDVKIGILIYNLRSPERRAKLTDEEIEELNSMGMVWDTGLRLNTRYTMLKQYYAEFGTIENVTSTTIYKQSNIGNLVASLRSEYKKGKLSEQLIEELETMGMVWGHDRLELLRAYYAEFGTIGNIGQHDICNLNGEEVKIGNVIKALKACYERKTLSQEDIDELEAMGMVWKHFEHYNRLEVLQAYYAEFGSLSNINKRQVYNFNGKDIKIGALICNLRAYYNKGLLKQEEIDKYEAMGMIWKYDKLRAFRAYYAEFGTLADISQDKVYSFNGKDVKIGSLINNLRYLYKKGGLKQQEVEELEAMGMVWDASFQKRRQEKTW